MPTFAEITATPEDLAAVEAIAREAQDVTGLPLPEAGCYIKCVMGARELIARVSPDLPSVLLSVELANLIACEPTDVLPFLVEGIVMGEPPDTTGVYLVAVKFMGISKILSVTIPLSKEEVPSTPPNAQDERGKIWNLYPHHPDNPALFFGKGVGAALKKAHGTLPPSS